MIKHFDYIYEIYKERSFTKAAEMGDEQALVNLRIIENEKNKWDLTINNYMDRGEFCQDIKFYSRSGKEFTTLSKLVEPITSSGIALISSE